MTDAENDLADLAAPSLADLQEMAETALATLPPKFRAALGNLVVRVADFADDETLAEMEIEDPFELTGLYQGTALPAKSFEHLPGEPDTVWLFRRPILDEWADRGDVALGDLVAHVLVHEIAHHFGYSDDDIAAIDDWRH